MGILRGRGLLEISPDSSLGKPSGGTTSVKVVYERVIRLIDDAVLPFMSAFVSATSSRCS